VGDAEALEPLAGLRARAPPEDRLGAHRVGRVGLSGEGEQAEAPVLQRDRRLEQAGDLVDDVLHVGHGRVPLRSRLGHLVRQMSDETHASSDT
jgi:hypothetical protein